MRSLLAICLLISATSASAKTPKLGEVFPDFEAKDLISGETFKLSDTRGKVVIIDFWATWCGPCRAELPNLKALYDASHADGLEVVSISLDSNLGKLKRYVEQQKLTWSHIGDGRRWDSKWAKQFGITSIPRMFVVGRDGVIVAARARGSKLRSAVKKALAQKAPEGSPEASESDVEPTAEATIHQLDRWLKIARGMAHNGNLVLARRYYGKLVNQSADAAIARIARDEVAKMN